MRTFSSFAFLFAFAAAASPAGAACVPPGPLVTATWLAARLQDPAVVVLSISDKAEYDAGHIPGALLLPFADLYEKHGALSMELPPMDRLADVFRNLGVTDGSCIVIAGFTEKAGLAPGARAFLTLHAMGLGAQSALLDGGAPQWRREGRPFTTEVRAVEKGTLTLHPRSEVIVDAAYVQSHLRAPGIAIVDARPAASYVAEARAGERGGHIPGAVNIPRSTMVAADGTVQPTDALRKLLEDAGIRHGDHIVAYCNIGQQASVTFFAAHLLGYDVRLYDGSWEEWSAHPDLPVEGPVTAK